MSEFRWNSGGSLHSKDWEEHLPTDSAVSIVLQLSIYTVCLYEVVLPHICNHPYSLNTLNSQLHL
jgi:hypothetical protein